MHICTLQLHFQRGSHTIFETQETDSCWTNSELTTTNTFNTNTVNSVNTKYWAGQKQEDSKHTFYSYSVLVNLKQNNKT